MSGCRFDEVEIEAYVFNELSAPRAARVRDHVAACPACAAELAALRAERALFAARAAHEPGAEALPGFADVLARSRGEVIPLRRRRLVAFGLSVAAAAAMIAGVFVASNDSGLSAGLAEGPRAEPPPEFSCYEGEPISMEDSAHVLDRAIAHIEVEYGACLLATPPEGPPHETSACMISTPVTNASLRQQNR
jgi:hypothetical protein